MQFIDSSTENKQRIIEKFNDPKSDLRILISTDTLSEGYNISGADLVINFDVPYNPVRIIQRIGRATRLDHPKEIQVLNFRPADVLDIELKLVERMELRIKDIIRFVGVEYRIWFETEKALLAERRVRDKRMYLEVLGKIRGNLRKGNFKELEVSINYSKPILIFLQKAIKHYALARSDVAQIHKIQKNTYSLFQGEKGLSVISKGNNSFNEAILANKEIIRLEQQINFDEFYKSELSCFNAFKENKKKEELKIKYFNDIIDKLANGVIDHITSQKLTELYPNAENLKLELESIRNRCGNNTGKILKQIKLDIASEISNVKINEWISQLEESFSKCEIQRELTEKRELLFAIGFDQGLL
jgi:superfamily II DNA or RNA helicase